MHVSRDSPDMTLKILLKGPSVKIHLAEIRTLTTPMCFYVTALSVGYCFMGLLPELKWNDDYYSLTRYTFSYVYISVIFKT